MSHRPVTITEQVKKMLDSMKRKQDYMVKLMEFITIANMGAAHRGIAGGLMQEASELTEKLKMLPREEKYEETRNQLLEAITTNNNQAQLFMFVWQNDAEALEQISGVILPILQKKYPILMRKPKESAEIEKNHKCKICGREATVGKNGVYSCREHFTTVFKDQIKRVEDDGD